MMVFSGVDWLNGILWRIHAGGRLTGMLGAGSRQGVTMIMEAGDCVMLRNDKLGCGNVVNVNT